MLPATMFIRLILPLLLLAGMGLSVRAQQEADLADGESAGAMSVIGLHRSWLPSDGYRPNTGMFFETIGMSGRSPVNSSFMLLATGMGERNILALMAGAGVTVIGDDRFGVFAAANLGVTFGSNTGLLAFDVITDPTLSVGLAGLARIGGRIPLSSDLVASLSVVQSWFSNEGGATPPGVQIGISLGGGR